MNKCNETRSQLSTSSQLTTEFNILDIEEITLTPKKQPKQQQEQQPPQSTEEGFETPEHIDIGKTAFEQFIKNNEGLEVLLQLEITRDDSNNGKMTSIKIPFENQKWIEAGEIVALAGDFFGKPKQPICFGTSIEEQKNRFKKAYATLLKAQYSNQIPEVIKYAKAQHDKRHGGKGPSIFAHGFDKTYKQNCDEIADNSDSGLISNLKYSLKTRKVNKPWKSRYARLSLTNFDHFGEQAKDAFRAGFLVAIDTAKKAAQAKDEQENHLLLRTAITQILFACHYLTDLYAAGHIRTPRKQLLNILVGNPINAIPDVSSISTAKLMAAGFLAKEMHDETVPEVFTCA